MTVYQIIAQSEDGDYLLTYALSVDNQTVIVPAKILDYITIDDIYLIADSQAIDIEQAEKISDKLAKLYLTQSIDFKTLSTTNNYSTPILKTDFKNIPLQVADIQSDILTLQVQNPTDKYIIRRYIGHPIISPENQLIGIIIDINDDKLLVHKLIDIV